MMVLGCAGCPIELPRESCASPMVGILVPPALAIYLYFLRYFFHHSGFWSVIIGHGLRFTHDMIHLSFQQWMHNVLVSTDS